MNATNEKTLEVLNDLVRINNDRTEGYEKAVKELSNEDADLRDLFNSMAADSRKYAAELSGYVHAGGDEPAEDTTIKGKIYRAWMDVKATFSGKSRKAILGSCEYGEDAAQKAYEQALEESEVTGEIRQVIMNQKSELRRAHDQIKRLRDMQHA